jgi:N-acetylneuraminate synthase/N,N'-diacetyllegionaminate synthase
MDLAQELIVLAKKGGADVAKFQVYEAKSLFPPAPENPWYEYNCQTELTKKQVYHLA